MRKILIQALVATGIFATSSFATSFPSSTASVTSVPGVYDSAGGAAGPYAGTFGALTVAIYCNDDLHNITIGAAPIDVNVSDVSNLSLTRFGGAGAATSLTMAVAVADYEKIFYLSTFLTGSYAAPGTFYTGKIVGADNSANSSVVADIQDAMWSYFKPTVVNAGSNAVGYWLGQATTNYAGYDYSTYRILTDKNDQYNGVQELFVNTTPGNPLHPTPEPATLAMLLGGLATVGFRLRKRSVKAAV